VRLILILTGDVSPGADKTRTLSSGTLSIGRGPGNDWVLPDPERILSKTHCTITEEDGEFILTDLSSNGVYVNGASQPTVRESSIVLAEGDVFRLGDYVMSVRLEDRPAHGAGGDDALADPLGASDDPLGDASGGNAHDAPNPLDADPLDIPFGRSSDRAFPHPIAAPVPTSLRGPDPFDLEGKRTGRPANRDEDLFRGIAPAGNWQGAPRPDHAPAPAQAMPPPRVTVADEIDFDALIGDLKLPGLDSSSPVPAVPAENRSPTAPPPTVASPPQHRAEAAGATCAGIDARAAFAAFLDGAGLLGRHVDDADPQAALRGAGKVFRAMAEGVRDVLISRATIKAELRIAQTMISARGNNALKFAVTADDAVLSLLTPRRPGYMEPLAAAQGAFADIKSHELAVMAGVQTALLTLLRRFDPNALEERLSKGRLEAVLPGARKARYWDAFRLTYGDISREAEDDFQAVFGRSFAEAYMAQTRKE
jgi:type VI secretion system protein